MNKILYGLILIAVMAMIFGSTGCRTPQKASSRLVYRGMGKDAKTVYRICSDIAPPVESVRDSFVYIQGETITLKGDTVFSQIDCDSAKLIGIRYVKVPQLRVDTIVRTDTIRTSNSTVKVDRAKEYALRDENKELTEANIKLKQTKKILWIAVIILAVYTILRWVLRAYKINLP